MNLDLRGLIPASVLAMTEDARIDEPGLHRDLQHAAAARPPRSRLVVPGGGMTRASDLLLPVLEAALVEHVVPHLRDLSRTEFGSA